MQAQRGAVVGDIDPMLDSWGRHLRAENRSPPTIQSYTESVHQLARFLHARGMPTDVARIRREHVESFLEDLLSRFRPATAAFRFRSLQQFFKWLRDEGEISESPMVRMSPPSVPEAPPPVITPEQMEALLKACSGPGFEERRDTAILLMFWDTGARLGEMAGLQLNDVNLGTGLVTLTGKGSRTRIARIGDRAALAVDRYLRRRGHRPFANLTPALWLGKKGAMTESGIAQMIRRRGREAGLDGLHPHLFRREKGAGAIEQERLDDLAKEKIPGRVRFMIPRELRGLLGKLGDQEDVVTLAQGAYDGKQGLVAVTDRRVLFIDEGMIRSRLEDFPYERVSSVQTEKGILKGKLTIFASGNKAVIDEVFPKERAVEIGHYVRGRISSGPSAPPPPPAVPAGAGNPADRLRKLAELRDAGVITPRTSRSRRPGSSPRCKKTPEPKRGGGDRGKRCSIMSGCRSRPATPASARTDSCSRRR